MHRRNLLWLAALPALLNARLAHAHHGWSSFDQGRPIYLEGKVTRVKWSNPHVELVLEVPADLKLPAGLAERPVPAQASPIDGRVLLAKATVPTRKDKNWEIELAPLTRMDAWKVPQIKVGDTMSMVGFTFKDEKGEAILRVEYLYLDGKAYGLRSSPA